MSIVNFPLPNSVTSMRIVTVPKGSQTVIHIEGSPSSVIVCNPANGSKPYFTYMDRGFKDEVELEGGLDAK